jgi:serine/threonine protein kinase
MADQARQCRTIPPNRAAISSRYSTTATAAPLYRLLGAPMEVKRFLRLALGIDVALGKFHQRGLIHKDIKPVNIILNDATGEVRLTGFGIA